VSAVDFVEAHIADMGGAGGQGRPTGYSTRRIVMGMVGSDRSSRDPREVDRYCMLGR
jgi:hypothetical protein